MKHNQLIVNGKLAANFLENFLANPAQLLEDPTGDKYSNDQKMKMFSFFNQNVCLPEMSDAAVEALIDCKIKEGKILKRK